MANIGPTAAFYNVETSLTRANNEANISRERIASGKQNAYAGDRSSNAAMVDAFRLDHVSTKAGIKGASVVMGYLETGMKVIGSASALLARLQELAVLGANGTNTFEEHEMINAEAEAIAQEFNHLMQGATYKGKDIFIDTSGSEYLSMGVRNAELTFGLGKIDYPLLADVTKKIATDFGVLIEGAGVALRGLFIIDDNDVVQHSTINNLGVGRNVDEVLRLVEAFQYTAKHGEVCPAGWTKGADSMKPDPKGSKEWFSKNK